MNTEIKNETKREKRKREGLCIDCGKRPSVNGRLRCRQCLDKHAATIRARYHKRAENGLCTRCGRKAAIAYRVCLKCRHKKFLENNRYYHRHMDRILEKAKAQRDQWKAEGKCCRCGGEFNEDNRMEDSGMCLDCYLKRYPGPSKPMGFKEVIWGGGWRELDPKFFPGLRETVEEANQQFRELYMEWTEEHLTRKGADPKTIKKEKEKISQQWFLA